MADKHESLTDGDRAAWPVLVPDAHAIGMIAVIRSLGRAGYPVHAAASRSDALGLVSNFAGRAAHHADYADPAFLPWLAGYVREHGIRCIVPSEGFLLAIRPAFAQYAPLLPIPQDEQHVYAMLSKSAVIASLLAQPDTAAHLPPTLFWQDDQALPAADAVATLGLPVFVKGDGADARSGSANMVVREDSVERAVAAIGRLSGLYTRVIVQGFVPGQGTGAYLLVDRGRVVQEFMNRCLHEVPHTGGFCSLRDSWWHAEMMQDARLKLAHLGWQGVAMLEYRWCPDTDRFWFIEINARFWAALHLALYAGIDFPVLLLDRFRGAATAEGQSFATGLLCRYSVPFDVGYVVSRWRDKQLSLTARLGSMAGWFVRFLNPRIHEDLRFPGDRALYWKQWALWLRGLASRSEQPTQAPSSTRLP